MQPVINVHQSANLYQLLNQLVDVSTTCYIEPVTHAALQPDSVVIWSPDTHSSLLDDYSKVALVESYARKLHVKITLSAASDEQLRMLGHRMGWIVLWEDTFAAPDTTVLSALVC